MICTESRKGILACVFYEGVSHEWISRDLLFTAHKDGVVRVRISENRFTDVRFGVDMFAKKSDPKNQHGN